MCGTLSSSSRETATVRRASMAVGAGRFFMPLPSGWKASGMNAWRPRGLVLQRAQAQQVVDAVLEGLDVPVEHRRVGAHARGGARRGGPRGTRRPSPCRARCARAPRDGRSRRRRPAGCRAPRARRRSSTSLVGHPVVLGEEVDLHRREALHVNVGLDALEAGEELLVVRERQPGVQAVDDVDLARRVVHARPRARATPPRASSCARPARPPRASRRSRRGTRRRRRW